MVRIGVLTSSRADFGVYLPLLRAFQQDNDIIFDLIVFGTHLSQIHGYTINNILEENFRVNYRIPTVIADDTENAIATSAALTSLKFADFWANHNDNFDIVLCLGDRYEMFAAVISGVPFGVKFAHLYGGDQSLGAIDNVYRDGMTHASVMHFTSTQRNAERIKRMVNSYYSIDVVGVLSLEDIENLDLLSIEEFKHKWLIDMELPTILVTFHPETIHPENNKYHALIIYEVLKDLVSSFQLVITMPNADTAGKYYRKTYYNLKQEYEDKIHLIETFGTQSYFTCMKHSQLMIGNTSSGISESGSFNKYFLNIGERQIGREFGPNVFSCPYDKNKILEKIQEITQLGKYKGINIYHKNGAIHVILAKLKNFKV